MGFKMGGTRHKAEYKDPKLLAARMSVTAKPMQMTIRLRHLAPDNAVLSEAHLSPEEAYQYAQALLNAYDECLGI